MPPQPLQLLLIEDNDTDIMLVQAALSGTDVPVPTQLLVVHGTVQAEKMLEHQPIDLILLDNSLSGRQGLSWLQHFKTSHPRSCIPVIMLTASDDDQFVRAAYQQYASAYLVKPLNLPDLRQMLYAMLEYWGKVARLPPNLST